MFSIHFEHLTLEQRLNVVPSLEIKYYTFVNADIFVHYTFVHTTTWIN